jgi:hypothetical protein
MELPRREKKLIVGYAKKRRKAKDQSSTKDKYCKTYGR